MCARGVSHPPLLARSDESLQAQGCGTPVKHQKKGARLQDFTQVLTFMLSIVGATHICTKERHYVEIVTGTTCISYLCRKARAYGDMGVVNSLWFGEDPQQVSSAQTGPGHSKRSQNYPEMVQSKRSSRHCFVQPRISLMEC